MSHPHPHPGHLEAMRRWKSMLRTGEYLVHDDVRAYALALGRGKSPAVPLMRRMDDEELARLRASARRLGDG